MRSGCARQPCGNFAVAICAIDPPSTTVVLLPLDSRVVGSPLCERHTEGLRVPDGWQLLDERDARGLDRLGSVVEGTAPEPDAGRDAGDLEALLDARSPLLSRAFRTAGND